MSHENDEFSPSIGLGRRNLLKALGIGAVSTTGLTATTGSATAEPENHTYRTITLTQGGTTVPLAPLESASSGAEFFGDQQDGVEYTLNTEYGIEASDAGQLYLHRDPSGATSLQVALDRPGDGSGGSANIEFGGLSDGSSETLFTESFDDNALDEWSTTTDGNADVINDDGRLRCRVYRCSTAQASRTIGPFDGRIEIGFSWQHRADQWWEVPDWYLEDESGNRIDYEVTSGTDVTSITEPGTSRSESVTVEADVSGELTMVYELSPSSFCSNFDHYDSFFWVDDIVVREPTAGSWVAQDSPDAFAAGSSSVSWSWGPDDAAGGVFEGGLDDEFNVDVTPVSTSGLDSLSAVRPASSTQSVFELDSDYDGQTQQRPFETVEQDLSAFAGQTVTLEFAVNGRHTYDRENTVSTIRARSIQIDGVLNESFEDIDGWVESTDSRDGQYNDTPTVGFSEVEDGVLTVQEESNRTRYLQRQVEIPEGSTATLAAEVAGEINAPWSFARFSVTGYDATSGETETVSLTLDEPITISAASNRTTEPSPPEEEVNLGVATDEKLDLAGRIDTISGGFTDDQARVSPTLTELEQVVGADSITAPEAVAAIDRMKLGESVTETLFEGALDVAPRRTANYGVPGWSSPYETNTAFVSRCSRVFIEKLIDILVTVVFFDRVLKRIPRLGSVLDDANSWLSEGVESFAEYVGRRSSIISESDYFLQDVIERSSDFAEGIINTILQGGYTATQYAGDKGGVIEPIAGLVESLLLNLLDPPVDLDSDGPTVGESLDKLDEDTSVTDAGGAPSFETSPDQATTAATTARQDIASTYEQRDESLTNTLQSLQAFDVIGQIIEIAGLLGSLLLGLGSVLVAAGSIIQAVGDGIEALVAAIDGGRTLLETRARHATSLELITGSSTVQ